MRLSHIVCATVIFACSSSQAVPGEVTYEYDAAGRLKRVIYPQGMTKAYSLDPAGNRTNVASALDTNPPTAPTGLVIQSASSSIVNLTWSPSTDDSRLTGYEIERCVGSGCSTFAPLGSATSTAFADGTVSGTVNYSYRVRARDFANNSSAYSAVASILTPDTITPSTPGTLSASSTQTGLITLSWGGSTDSGGSGLAGYKVYRNGAYYTSSSVASYNDTGVSGSTSYSYAVSAYDGANNESTKTNTVSIVNPDTLAPSTPTMAQPSLSGATTVTVAWSQSSDAGGSGIAGYELHGNCRGGWATLVTGLSFVDSAAGSAGQTCSYWVLAKDRASNYSVQSNTVSITLPTPPAAPGTISGPASIIANGPVSFTLSWAAVSTATSYQVWDTTGGSTLAASGASTSVSLTRSPCQVWTFRVKACNVAGCSGYSPTKSVKINKTVSCI